MFIYTAGDIFYSEADALVNPVNTMGIMGKGLAYKFKNNFPLNYIDYIRACKNNELYIGSLHYFKEKEKLIINFPTKTNWRYPSKIEYIDIGLDKLIELIKKKDIKSIAIPPLGCGNGGLPYYTVKDLIINKLYILKDVKIYLYFK